jgi:hypothetical protein
MPKVKQGRLLDDTEPGWIGEYHHSGRFGDFWLVLIGSETSANGSTMKFHAIFLLMVVAVICFSTSCTKLYYTDSAGKVQEWRIDDSADRKALGDRGHSPNRGQ